MSYQGPDSFRKLVQELAKLPSVGERTAQRLVFHLIHRETEDVEALVLALGNLKEKLRLCEKCFGLTDEKVCPVCLDSKRDSSLLCVVEHPSDLFAVEGSGIFRGAYHVLHGALAPLEGKGPEDLKIREFKDRLENQPPKEVLLATNPNVEGDATALYLARLCQKKGIQTSRIAMGIPMGGHLEYADQVTLGRAILERRTFSTT